MIVSVVIPVNNEEKSIGNVLRKMPRDVVNEVVIVYSSSRESKTYKKVKANIVPHKDKLVKQRGKGYGSAIMQGIDVARGEIIIIMDADGSHNPGDIPKLVDKIERGNGFVLASRYAPGGRSDGETWVHWFGNRMFTWLTNTLHGTSVTDSLYLFTAITREGYKKLNLKCTNYDLGIELLIKAHRAGLKFAEVPSIEDTRLTRKSVNTFYDGFKILKIILKRYH